MTVSSERVCEIEQLLDQCSLSPQPQNQLSLKSFVGNLISFLSVFAKVS